VSEINVAQPALSQGSATVSGMGHLLGYARVSTTDQHPQLQVDTLQRAGCYRVFTETASGARTDRPTLAQVLDQLRPGDTLVVWKLDRLKLQVAQDMYRSGQYTVAAIAKALGVSRASIYRHLTGDSR
jgi:DNA invertase Pin-like site-specific DNA recombinase